jgi:cell division protein FtsB
MRLAGLMLVVSLVSLQYRLWLSEGSIPSLWRLESAIFDKVKLIQEQRDRNQILVHQVRDLQQGLGVVEERARSELGMIQQGEVYYQVIGSPEHQ